MFGFDTIIPATSAGSPFRLEYVHSSDLPAHLRAWTLDLVRKNMQQLYEGCGDWGWDGDGKAKELGHKRARFLLAWESSDEIQCASVAGRNRHLAAEHESSLPVGEDASPGDGLGSKRKPIGFLHLRWEMDDEDDDADDGGGADGHDRDCSASDCEDSGGDDDLTPPPPQPIMYIYEIQVAATHQRRGVGHLLMTAVRGNSSAWHVGCIHMIPRITFSLPSFAMFACCRPSLWERSLGCSVRC